MPTSIIYWMFPKQQMILSPEKLATFFDPSLAYVQMQNLCKLRTKTKKMAKFKSPSNNGSSSWKEKEFFWKKYWFFGNLKSFLFLLSFSIIRLFLAQKTYSSVVTPTYYLYLTSLPPRWGTKYPLSPPLTSLSHHRIFLIKKSFIPISVKTKKISKLL